MAVTGRGYRGIQGLASCLSMSIVLAFAASAYCPSSVKDASPDTTDNGGRFFNQLQKVFGRFRDSDFQRVFELARPIECSELVTENGEWREVAFFNENRTLGGWYRTSLREVKNDLA